MEEKKLREEKQVHVKMKRKRELRKRNKIHRKRKREREPRRGGRGV